MWAATRLLSWEARGCEACGQEMHHRDWMLCHLVRASMSTCLGFA